MKGGCEQSRSGGTDFGPLKKCLELTDSTIMRRWKWLFVNGCKCISSISTVTVFKLAPRWDEFTNVLECHEKKNDTLLE
jgi:hypothetical protein